MSAATMTLPVYLDMDVPDINIAVYAPDPDGDSHLVVRETAPWRANAKFERVLSIRRDEKLARDLAWEHGEKAAPAEPSPEPGVLASWLEMISVYFCNWFHNAPTYDGGNYSQCACGKRFAVPWADLSKISTNVYVQEAAEVPAQPRQVQAC